MGVLDLDDLAIFVEIADAGGVSPAARRLGVSKSIVSRRLSRLERELGVQLLARTTRGAALTEAGSTFRDHAARIGAEMDMAREVMVPVGDLRGRLRLAVPLAYGTTHLAPILAELARRHPALQVQTSYSEDFVDLVSEGFDAAIRIGHLADSSLVARRVGAVRPLLVASPAYIDAHGAPRTPVEIGDHEALMQGTESWRFMTKTGLVSVHPQGRFKTANAFALAEAAKAGIGIAYLPDSVVVEEVASGDLRVIMPNYPPAETGIHVVRPAGIQAPRKVRILIDILLEYLGKSKNAPKLARRRIA
jgi:DNA-binding transcriptional LysR family regulator